MASKRKSSGGTDHVQKKAKSDKGNDEEDMDCSQHPDFKYNPTMGTEAEVGIIERVTLRNFMCHDKLDIQFGANVNFLIGRNGSGKSAVLTGIVVGLGGKASATNRGLNVRGFIKNNKQSGDVIIKLRNRGPDAYKPKEYGSSIIVERRLSAEQGSGGYKLKSSDGKLISKKHEELIHILDQFNIQVDNPVAILNQETSRNFLHSKSPQDKYKFFLKATQLEQMKDDYILANEKKNVAIGFLQQKQEHLPQLEKEVHEWEQKFKAFEAIEELKSKVSTLKNEMAWAIVSEKEKGVEPIKKELKSEETRRPKFVKHVEESESKVQKVLKTYEDVQKSVKKMSEDIKDLEPQHKNLKASRDDKKKSFKAIQNEVVRIQRDLKSNEKDKKQLEERIEELRSSVQHDYEAQRRSREERIEQLCSQVKTLKAQQKTSEHSLEQYRSAVAKAKEDMYRFKTDEQDLRRLRDNIKAQIRDLESARSNKLKRFGQYMPDLINRVEAAFRNGKFHQKPKGPLGAGLNLRQQKWAQAMEVCFGALLYAFCVNDHHDERELEKIMNQVVPKNSRKPVIITNKFRDKIYDVHKHKCQTTKYPTVLEMLDLKTLDPVIANCLIDQRSIETILLIEGSTQARQVMYNPPKNTTQAFTLEGDQLHCHPMFRYYSNTAKQANLLTSNIEDNIRKLNVQLRKYEEDLSHMQERSAKTSKELSANQTHEKTTMTQISKIANQVARFEFEIEEQKNYEEPSVPDVTTLEEEVSRYDEILEELQTKVTKANARLADAKSDFESAEKEYGEIDKKIRAIAQNSDPVQEELAKIEGQIEKAKSDKRHYENKMKEHEKKINELKKQFDAKETDVSESIAKAEQICARVSTRRTAKNIESEIVQIQKRISAEEKTRGNQEEITRKYHETVSAYRDIKRKVNQQKNFLKKLTETLEIRDIRYAEFVHYISNRTNFHLITNLTKLRFVGRIHWKHDSEECLLKVQPSKIENGDNKDMRSLSGGERSFATVCFILALWDAMESPFRMLDEFDVFMDMVNRRVSMEMMLNTAKGQTGRQFIFLTPLDTSYLKLKNNIRVFRLQAPERGQTTLTFTDRHRHTDDDEDDEQQAGPSHA